MELTNCPQCGTLAEIVWRDVLESTDGPIEHAKVRCLDHHWFLLPGASLASPRLAPAVVDAHTPALDR